MIIIQLHNLKTKEFGWIVIYKYYCIYIIEMYRGDNDDNERRLELNSSIILASDCCKTGLWQNWMFFVKSALHKIRNWIDIYYYSRLFFVRPKLIWFNNHIHSHRLKEFFTKFLLIFFLTINYKVYNKWVKCSHDARMSPW